MQNLQSSTHNAKGMGLVELAGKEDPVELDPHFRGAFLAPFLFRLSEAYYCPGTLPNDSKACWKASGTILD